MESPGIFEIGLLLSGGFAAYGVLLAVYRLFFHPLRAFPGPKLSAATSWYEFYYEIIQPGSWLWEIQRLHEVYGKNRLNINVRMLLTDNNNRANCPHQSG